jgi:anti-anti-sigma regulatory factor
MSTDRTDTAPATLAEDAARDAGALRLPAELTIYTAAETRGAWLAWLDSAMAQADLDEPVCAVDASACDEIDAAGSQLLVALAHSLARRQRRLQLCRPSSPVRDACTGLGLAAWLIGDAAGADATTGAAA